MALYEAYFDESYTSPGTNPQVLVVGGYVYRAEDLPQFEAEWKAALDSADVSLFHMNSRTELASLKL
jgi:hypothetical protein